MSSLSFYSALVVLSLCMISLTNAQAQQQVEGADDQSLEEFCSLPENRLSCHLLLVKLMNEQQKEPEEKQVVNKRKPSFVRFGKRSDPSMQMEKRKPSFVRFGRK